ncbi:MAG: Uma2 family endonuclease [Gemmatimonadaceae bacterium]
MTPPILPLPGRRLTFDEYLEFEMASPLRHEFVAGEVYAMEGASRRHHHVVGNIFTRLHSAARGGPCEVFAHFKLRIGDDVYYPDVMVACSASDTHDLWAREPCLLVEVTSPSTARIDRTHKLDAYRAIPSLRAYVIVEQAWRRVVRHRRDEAGAWLNDELLGDGSIQLPCPELAIAFDQIYEGLAPLTVRELEAIGYGIETA